MLDHAFLLLKQPQTKKTYRDAMEDPPGPNYAQNLLNQRV